VDGEIAGLLTLYHPYNLDENRVVVWVSIVLEEDFVRHISEQIF
jgi:hypothetical protein